MKKLSEAYALPDEIAHYMSHLNNIGDWGEKKHKNLGHMEFIMPVVKEEHHELLKHAPMLDKRDPEENIRLGHLLDYSDSSEGLNLALIHGNRLSEHETPYISAFHHTKFDLPHDTHVYSGLKFYNPHQDFERGGGVIHLPAYTSTSLDPHIAARFTEHNMSAPGLANESHIIHFHLPKGFRNGTYLAAYGNAPSEYEYTLHPGKFRLVSKETREFKTPNSYSKKVHIWSVVPHKESLKETTFDASDHLNYLASVPGQMAARMKDIREQHTRLIQSFNKSISKEDREHLARYCLDSQPTNYTLLHQAGHNISPRQRVWAADGSKQILLSKEESLREFSQHAEHMSRIIKEQSIPLDHDVHVYSGTNKFVPTNHIKKGIFHTPAFTSTSISPTQASTYTHLARATRHILHFHLPAGYNRGLYMGHDDYKYSAYPEEQEFLLDKDQKWRHLQSRHVNDYITVHSFAPHEESLKEDTIHDTGDILQKSKYVISADAAKYKLSPEFERIRDQHDRLVAHRGIKNILDYHQDLCEYKDSSGSINRALLRTSTHNLSADRAHFEMAQRISDAISKYGKPLDEDLHVYSGTKNWRPNFSPNSHVILPAFTSSSLYARYAKQGFTTPQQNGDFTSHILHFHLPKGYRRGLYLESHNEGADCEHEYLIDKGQKWLYKGSSNHEWKEKFNNSKVRFHHLVPHEESLKEALEGSQKLLDDLKGDAIDDIKTNFTASEEHHELAAHFGYPVPTTRFGIREFTTNTLDLNHALINDKPMGYHTKLKHEKMIQFYKESKPLKKAYHVYSGLATYDPSTHMTEDGVFKNASWISASLNPHVAAVRNNNKRLLDTVDKEIVRQPDHVLHFELPEGSKHGVYIGHLSDYEREREFAIHPNQKWKVVSKEVRKGGRTIWHVVPHNESLKEAYEHDPNHIEFHRTENDIEDFSQVPKHFADEHKELKAHFKIPSKYRESISSYTDSSHSVNEAINKPHMFHYATANDIGAAIEESAPLQRDLHVYSGIGGSPRRNSTGIIKFPYFTSTSINPGVAKVHSNSKTRTRYTHSDVHILHFHLPAGYNRGIYVAHHSEFAGETEYILGHGQKFKIHSTPDISEVLLPGHKIGKLHVWHLTPHDESLKEATYHDAESFLGVSPWNKEYRKIRDNAQDQHKELQSYTSRWHADTSARSFILGYKAHSADINSALIEAHQHGSNIRVWANNGMSDAIAASNIRDAIREHAVPLKSEIHVYSGTRAWNISSSIKDGILHTPAFTSTSLHPGIARGFANHGVEKADILHFHLPKGYRKGIYLEHEGSISAEHEYLLDADQKWKHIRTEEVDSPYTNMLHKTVKYRVHTLVPHEEELKEATFHDIQGFQDHRFNHHGADVETQHALMSIAFGKAPSAEALKHFRLYKSDSSGMNYALLGRYKDTEFGKIFNQNIDSHLERAHILSKHIHDHSYPLPHDTHVYSGVGGFDVDEHITKGNGIFHTPAFTSTSLDPARSKWFAHLAGENKRLNILHFHLPKGFNRGTYIDSDVIRSWSSHEKEYLIDKGMHWKFVKKETTTDQASKMPIDVWTLKPHDPSLHETFNPFTPEDMADKWPGKRLEFHHGYTARNSWQNRKEEFPEFEWDHPEAEEQHKLLSELHVSKYNDEQRKSIFKYTQGFARSFNMALLGRDGYDYDQFAQDHIKNLDSLFKTAGKLDRDVHAYSATQSHPALRTRRRVISTPAFTSASINPHIAFDVAKAHPLWMRAPHWANKRTEDLPAAEHHILHFHLPKGSQHAAYLGDAAHYAYTHQREILINRDTKWDIVGHHIHKMDGVNDNGEIDAKRHFHIWSLRPHEENLKETTFHSKHFFTSIRYLDYTKQDPIKPNAKEFRNKINAIKLAGLDDAKNNHAKTLKISSPHNLTAEEESAIYFYTHDSAENSYLVNRRLLGNREIEKTHHFANQKSEVEHIEKHLPGIFAKSVPLEQEGHFYSGLKRFNPEKHFDAARGIVHTPAYVSTSSNPESARGFAGIHEGKNIHILHFHLPKGYNRGAYLENHTACPGEHEYLLDKGQKWKLVRKQTANELSKWKESDSYRGGSHVKIHIWSVVPHEGDLKEATYHDPDVFRRLDRRKTSFHNNPKYFSPKTSLDNAAKKISDKQTLIRADVHNQNDHLIKTHAYVPYSFHVTEYTRGSKHLNKYLINRHSDTDAPEHWSHENQSNAISAHIEAHGIPLEDEIHVYSGIRGWNPHHAPIVHTPAFISTTLNPLRAADFASNVDREKHILHFKLPKGYRRGLYVEGSTANPNEMEYLLDKGQHWRLVGHKVKNHAIFNSIVGGKRKILVKHHIWTLVPHEESLKEMAYHHDDSYDYSTDKSYMDLDLYQGRSDAVEKYLPDHLEEHEHLKKLHRAPQGIDNDHLDAVNRYTSDTAYSLNQDLHKGVTLAFHHQQLHERLGKFLDEAAPLDKEYHVYSGLGSTDPTQGMHNAKILHSRAYMSASISPEIAAMHNSAKGQVPHGTHIIHIRLPKGSKAGRYIAQHSQYEHEGEFLLKANQHYKIERHEVMHDDEGYMMHIWHVTPLNKS